MTIEKGNIPWNKGLTKETDERIRKKAEKHKGKPLSKQHKKNIGISLKKYYQSHTHHLIGKPVWNKGVPCREETKRKLSKIIKKQFEEGRISNMKGKHHTKEARRNISIAQKGKKNHNYGKHFSKEYRRKIGESNRGKIITEETRNKISKSLKGHRISEETKRKLSKANKGRKRPREVVERMIKSRKGYKASEETKRKLSKALTGNPKVCEANRKKWQNPEYREKTIKATLKALLKRPTKLETRYNEIFSAYNLPFNYCGDGSLLIGYKNPDFVENNGKKLCIEVANKDEKSVKRKHRSWNTWEEYKKQRIEHFAKHGWKCLVLWQEELGDENKVIQKTRNFCGEIKK